MRTWAVAKGATVPTHFYKVILAESTAGELELFAFLLANDRQPLAGEPRDYLVTVDSIEALSGLDFFSVLPDADEHRLEAAVATQWPIP